MSVISKDRQQRTETQASIAAWGEATFGPARNPGDLVARAQQELKELAEAAAQGQREEAAMETADVMILLYRLAEDLGYDLDDAVARKMAVNRARTWIRAGDGTGRHIETP